MASQELQPSTPNEQSVDVSPVSPRDDAAEEEDDPDLPHIPEPSKDWKFNIFLNRLSDGISTEEFKRSKYLFEGIISKKVLEQCETINDVFTIMKQRTFLSHDEILYLQSLIYNLNRRDLLQMCVDYARDIGDTIYFYTPPETAVEGYRRVQFHVEGKDFVSCKRSYVQKLRHKVAGIVFVPVQNVFIAGVEPSSSMLITLLIPEMYAGLLKEMIIEKKGLDDLVAIGVDVIGMEGKQYNIRVSEIEEVEFILTEQQFKLVSVYQQLQEKTQQLEEAQIDCLTLSKKLRMYEKTYMSNDALLMTFQKIFNTVVPAEPPQGQPATLKSQGAFANFKAMLKEVERVEYDRDLILGLLNANTAVSVNRLNEAYRNKIDKMFIELKELRSMIWPLKLELEKFQFLLQVDTDALDEVIFNTLLRPILDALQIQAQMPVTLRYINSLKKASRMLRCKDKLKLKQKYTWEKDDPVTKTMERDPDLFLGCLYLKEVETSGNASIDLVEFCTRCLEDVGRKDIIARFQEWVKQPAQPPSSSNGGKRKSKKKPSTMTPARDSSKSRKEGPPDMSPSSYNAFSGQLKAIEDKIDSLCTLIESSKDKPPSYASLCGDGDMYPLTMAKRPQMTGARQQEVY